MFNDKYLPIILQEVSNIREKYGLNADSPICDYIFTILQNECVLLEWPEEKQLDLDGFSTEKVINGQIETVVYINSAKNKEKQNFCAAHELGHRHKLECQLKDAFPNDIFILSTIETVMNRFAAELMMPAKDFSERSRELYKECLGKMGGKDVIYLKKLLAAIIELMDFYYVPYKAVVIRFEEMKVFSCRVSEFLQGYEKTDEGKDIINAIISERGITRLQIPDRKVQYSVHLEKLHDIVSDIRITKYMGTEELRRYLKVMGITHEDIQLIENMKKIEEEVIDIEDIEDEKPDD